MCLAAIKVGRREYPRPRLGRRGTISRDGQILSTWDQGLVCADENPQGGLVRSSVLLGGSEGGEMFVSGGDGLGFACHSRASRSASVS